MRQQFIVIFVDKNNTVNTQNKIFFLMTSKLLENCTWEQTKHATAALMHTLANWEHGTNVSPHSGTHAQKPVAAK